MHFCGRSLCQIGTEDCRVRSNMANYVMARNITFLELYRAFGIPISLRARDKLRGHTSFERWELAEQRTLKQKENIGKVSSLENKINLSSLQLKLHDKSSRLNNFCDLVGHIFFNVKFSDVSSFSSQNSKIKILTVMILKLLLTSA